jgi:hypothetical protein
MKNIKFAALAAALLLQSLACADNAPSHNAVSRNVGSVSLDGVRHTALRVEDNRDYFPLADISDSYREECDPEDDCPRPALPARR